MNKRDLIHVFNARGRSFLTMDHQEERIAELERENARLKDLLRQAAEKISANLEKAEPANSYLH